DTTVPSPCIGLCWLNDETQLCDGCFRNIDEIRDWMIMDKTEKLSILKVLEESGVDMVEIGMPYSDPLADGPVIQESNTVSIENGMSIATLLNQLKDIRKEVSIPILLMGYLNPVVQYGIEKFCNEIGEIGIDGLILPDLPMYEYETEYKSLFEKNNLSNIFLMTPQTSEDRLKKIDQLSEGFIYALSSNSTTGNAQANQTTNTAYLEGLSKKGFSNPVLIGFNIKDKASFDKACSYSNGAIIGSAFIKAINKENLSPEDIQSFVRTIRD
ncbi:MAG: tryptophan synthase subunit alpha, partial [Cyclobacteriaceae bacterium]